MSTARTRSGPATPGGKVPTTLRDFIAILTLLANFIVLFGLMAQFRFTLTLPGIAGVILTIGMAVDSNVLIYERMREEFHTGKPLKAGIDGGYDKAFWTIIDAHVTTLITAVVLFLFGTGPIKGFAVTLSLGVVLNLFTALFGTRVVYDWLLIKRWLKNLSFFEFFKQPNIDFIGWRHVAFGISGALCILGLIAFVQLSRGYGNLGVEFSGGTLVQMSAAQPFTVNDVRNAASCPAIDAYRQALVVGNPIASPAPSIDCPATFGNSDIFGLGYP